MADKVIKTRVVHKHDIALNWAKAKNFVPEKGELIIFDADSQEDIDRGFYTEYPLKISYINGVAYELVPSASVRFKIGNGSDNVNVLPFYLTREGVTSLTSGAVKYDLEDQGLQSYQKYYARNNIDAGLSQFVIHIITNDDGTFRSTKTYDEIIEASNNFYGPGERPIICYWEGFRAEPLGEINSLNPVEFLICLDGLSYLIQIDKDEEGNTTVDVQESYKSITIGSETWDGDNPEVDFTESINELIDNKNKVLIVNVREDVTGRYQCTHTPQQIYEHIQNGGVVVVREGLLEYQLLECQTTYADFYTITDEAIFRILNITPSNVNVSEYPLANLDVKPLIVTYNAETNIATHTASKIYEHISNGSTALLYNPEDSRLYPIGMCDETSAIFSGPITGEWELFLTRFYIDNEAKVQTYDTQLVCHYEFENESKPLRVTLHEDNTLSEDYETIVSTIESGRQVVIRDDLYYYNLEVYSGADYDIQFGAFTDDGFKNVLIVCPDSTYTSSSYQINPEPGFDYLGERLSNIEKIVQFDESNNETYVSADHLWVNSPSDDSVGVSFEAGQIEQLSDNPVQVLELYGTGGDELVRLRRIAPGTQEDDAVTLAQLNEATDIIPIEHSWNGTVLTIRSNSGESSMDLQGADGDNGCGIFGYTHEIDVDSTFINNVVYSHILYPAGRAPIVGDIVIGTNGQLATVYSITSDERVILSNLGINIKGDPGNDGKDGNSIADITKTSSEGLVDTYTVSFTNGETSNFTVTNGTNGSDGDKGDQGFGIVAAVERPSFTEAKWNEYGTIGDEETWSNTESIRNGCRVGDIFMVYGTATDTGNSHTLYFRNSSTSGNLGGVCIAHSVAKGGQKGDPGAPGNDGVGILSVEKESSSGLTDTYVINFTDGSSTTFLVKNGEKGKDGTPGVGIESVVQTVTSPDSGGTNKITVTKTDGTTSAFVIKNGEKGDNGDSITVSHITESTTDTGVKTHTVQFSDGSSFTLLDGVSVQSIVQTVTSTEDKGTNTITITNTDGTTSSFNILNGSKGSKGDKGDTPVKGVDYFTESDIQEIVQDVKDALPVDAEKSGTSTNPLQNQVITQEIFRLENGIHTVAESARVATTEAQRALNAANTAVRDANNVSGIVLNNIRPRVDALEKDVAKNSFENFPTSNLLNFYDPSLINVSYCNPKNLPGWQVRFNDSGVYDKSNEFFSGAEGMSEHKEITFKPAGNTINVGIQTASTAHTNSCKISNLSLVRTDGQSLGHLEASTTTFGENEAEVVHNDTFSSTDGWSGVKGAGTGYGRLDGTGLLLGATGWNGAGNKIFTVTPGILHTVSFYYKAVRNGLNFSIYNGTSKSGTKLGGGYLSKTSWTLVSYTFIPTSNNIYITFSGSNKGTTEAPDSMFVDDFIVSKATGYTLWDGIIKNTSSDGHFSTTMDNTKKSIRMKSNWSYWNEYIKIPLTGLNLTDTYILRFKADVTSNGVNLSGENISWITRDISYISSDGYYIASFQPSAVGTCYITFKGDGQSKDDVTISDIHIFNQNEPIGTLGLDNKRWIPNGLSEWQDNTLVLQGNGKTYSYGLRTLAVAVSPDVEYKLSFDVEYDKPNTYNWMPYITLTDEDKISLVTDSCIPTECPQCGGPWIGSTDSAHTLKFDIDIPNLPSKINPSMLQFVLGSDGGIVAATADVTLYSQPNNTVIATTSYNLIEEVDYNPGDVVCQVPIEADYTISRLSVVIIPDMTPALEGLLGNIRVKNLKLFANRRITDLPEQIKSSMPYYSGPNKEMIFYGKITAPLFDGKIDDGSLD